MRGGDNLDIGTFFTELFGPLGVVGGLICIFLLFYIDAIVFPTLPELFTVIIFTSYPDANIPLFAISILITIVLAEVAGVFTLYTVVKKIKVPERIAKVAHKYRDFLIVSDERMILLNRVAPVIPFMGAFVYLFDWSVKKSLAYVIAGGLIKYGVILALSGAFLAYMEHGTAQTVTNIMIIILMIISLAASYFKKKGVENANRSA